MEDLGDQVDYSPDPTEDAHVFYSSDCLGFSRAPGGSLWRHEIPQVTDERDCKAGHTVGMSGIW